MRRTSASFLARAAASASDSPPAFDASARRNPRSVAAEGAGAGCEGAVAEEVPGATAFSRICAAAAPAEPNTAARDTSAAFPARVTRASTAPFASGTRSSTDRGWPAFEGSGTPRRRRADLPNTSASPSGSGSDRPAWRPADASAGSSARSSASPRAPAAAAMGPARPDGRGRARHAGAPRRSGRARAAATTHRLTALFRSAGTAATGAATTHAAANISTRCLGTP